MQEERDSSVGNRLGLPKVYSLLLVFMRLSVFYLPMFFWVRFQIIIYICSYCKKELMLSTHKSEQAVRLRIDFLSSLVFL